MFRLFSNGSETSVQLIFDTAAWPALLVDAHGRILAASPPAAALFHSSVAELLQQPIDQVLRCSNADGLAAVIDEARQLGTRLHMHALVAVAHAPVIPVELEIIPDAYLFDTRTTIVMYPHSRPYRREQFILELNRLIPRVMREQTSDAVFAHMRETMQQIGLSATILICDQDGTTFLPHPQTMPPPIVGSEALFEPIRRLWYAPRTTPFLKPVVAEQRAIFHRTMQPMLADLLSPDECAFVLLIQQLLGIQGYVTVPMLYHGNVGFILIVWGPLLSADDVPFVEVFAGQVAAVLEQIDLRYRTEQRMQQLHSLAATARAVTTLGTLDEVLRTICDQARALLSADTAMICLPNPDGSLEGAMITGRWADIFAHVGVPPGQGMVGRAYTSGVGWLIPDAWADPVSYHPNLEQTTIHSVMLQPMRYQGTTLGVLMLASEEIARFTQADLEYMVSYAEFAAISIANAQLHAARERSEATLHKHRQELETLLRVSQSLSQSFDIDTLLNEMLRVLEEDLHLADMSGVLLCQTDSDDLIVALSRNLPKAWADDPALINTLLRIGAWTQSAFNAGRPIMVSLDDDLRPALRAMFEQLQIQYAAIVPLIAEGRLLGAVKIGRYTDRYTDQELQLLHMIAGQLAQAIANAQIHQALRTKAEQYAQLFEEAEAVRQYLTTVMHSAPDAFLILRRDGTIQPLSENPMTLFGYLLEEVVDRHFLEFVPDAYHAAVMAQWEVVQHGDTVQFETNIIAHDGRPMTVLVSAGRIKQYNEVLAVLKDVSHQRELETRVHQSEKLAALGQMVAGAAHELNNPLAVILGLAQLHLMDELPEPLRGDMHEIEHAAQRASTIVQQLRMFARPPSVQAAPVDPWKVLQGVLARLAPTLKKHQIVMETLAIGPLPPVAGNDHQIDQVLWNILQNAVRAVSTNPLERTRTIDIAVYQQDASVHIQISDNGPGIAEENLQRIFEPFFTTQDVGQGIGLGLAIVHAIMQQHNGEIWAESIFGSGATFHVRLPIFQPIALPVPQPDDESWMSEGEVRILIVEDEPMVRAVVVRTLAHRNWRIEAAASGVEALQLATAIDYDLIISDLQMPEIDGPMLYDQLAPHYVPARWLILTGDTMNERSQTFLERTHLRVLAKPFTREQLIRNVIACLQESATLTPQSSRMPKRPIPG